MVGFFEDDKTGAKSSTRLAMILTVVIPAFVFLVWGVDCLLHSFNPPSWEMVGLAAGGPAVGMGGKAVSDKIKGGNPYDGQG